MNDIQRKALDELGDVEPFEVFDRNVRETAPRAWEISEEEMRQKYQKRVDDHEKAVEWVKLHPHVFLKWSERISNEMRKFIAELPFKAFERESFDYNRDDERS